MWFLTSVYAATVCSSGCAFDNLDDAIAFEAAKPIPEAVQVVESGIYEATPFALSSGVPIQVTARNVSIPGAPVGGVQRVGPVSQNLVDDCFENPIAVAMLPGIGDCDEYYPDSDLDGYATLGQPIFANFPPFGYARLTIVDCDDNNPNINPGENEVCNGIDDNCRNGIDEGLPMVQRFRDNDGDTYGGRSFSTCDLSDGVSNGSDCDDTDPAINPGETETCNGVDNNCADGENDAINRGTYFTDSDGDTYGTGSEIRTCTQPASTATRSGDCADSNPNVNPGRAETCNGVDDDCVGGIDDGLPSFTRHTDADNDGFGAGGAFTTCDSADGVANNDDCDDSAADVNPAQPETCNGVDNNCANGENDATNRTSYYADGDNDGFGFGTPVLSCSNVAGRVTNGADCDDSRSSVNPNADEVCNDRDDDCVGGIDDGLPVFTRFTDGDNDGFGAGNGFATCDSNAGSPNDEDCNDSTSSIHPGVTETCNGVDNNCENGENDANNRSSWYADADADGFGTGSATLSCNAPSGRVGNDDDCNDADPAVSPDANEVCNGRDDDCVGGIDDGLQTFNRFPDTDNDGYGSGASFSTCDSGEGSSNNDDCVDTDANINPGETETCNGVDNNCSGDEDDATSQATWYTDGDSDGFGSGSGVESCAPIAGRVDNNDDCNDGSASVHPDADEVCNGADENCNNQADEGLDQYDRFTDNDGDGFGSSAFSSCDPNDGAETGDDCNDNNEDVNPDAVEVCNGRDDNCVGGESDAIDPISWPIDGDGDGFDGTSTVDACDAPSNHTGNTGDCDDDLDSVFPGANDVCNGIDENCSGDETDATGNTTWYRDDDGDGYGDATDTLVTCVQPAGYASQAGDCDDANTDINPGAVEVCNGFDDNCQSGETDAIDLLTVFVDIDGDGYGSTSLQVCEAAANQVELGGDCNDNLANINPGEVDVCNGIDDNCSGNEIDAVDQEIFYNDLDGDGDGAGNAIVSCQQPPDTVTTNTDCDDAEPSMSGLLPELCDDLLDNNCNGETDENSVDIAWYVDSDGDGFGDENGTAVMSCSAVAGSAPNNGDCDDSTDTVHPNQPEVCAGTSGIDENCDGVIDINAQDRLALFRDLDGDGYGDAAFSQSGCVAIPGSVANAGDCNDNDVSVSPAASDICDQIDNDCDGVADNDASLWPASYADQDGDGVGAGESEQISCTLPSGRSMLDGDCNDSVPDIAPGRPERCNSVDDDCDEDVDEAEDLIDGASFYVDLDFDGFGTGAPVTLCFVEAGYAEQNGDCDDSAFNVNPDQAEVCNLIDDDCDGDVDEDAIDASALPIDADGDGFAGSETELVCDGGGIQIATGDCDDSDPDISPNATEIPDNGIDEDCSGSDDSASEVGVACQTGSSGLAWFGAIAGLLGLRRRRAS